MPGSFITAELDAKEDGWLYFRWTIALMCHHLLLSSEV